MLERNLCSYVKTITAENGYSKEEQAQFLARLERACIDNPELPPTFVANCLYRFLSLSLTNCFLLRRATKEFKGNPYF